MLSGESPKVFQVCLCVFLGKTEKQETIKFTPPVLPVVVAAAAAAVVVVVAVVVVDAAVAVVAVVVVVVVVVDACLERSGLTLSHSTTVSDHSLPHLPRPPLPPRR